MDLVLRLALWAASGIQLPKDVLLFELPTFSQLGDGLAMAHWNDAPPWEFQASWVEL